MKEIRQNKTNVFFLNASTGPKVSGTFKKREPVCTQNRLKWGKLWDYKQKR